MSTNRSTEATKPRSQERGHVARLLVVFAPNGAGEGATRAVSSAGLTIHRRGADQGLELDDREVSKTHARIVRDPERGGYRIEDADSRNGTFLNGRRVTGAPLETGDVIRIGSHLLYFELLDIAAVQRLPLKRQQGEPLVGESHALCRVREEIRRAAPVELPVLVTGETGVGKELVAAELHRLSGRSGRFVPVNCAALPAHLVESELFGHVQGAFTGAQTASPGLFGEAEGGTLFLDEIGEMSIELQAKLLRVLATGEVRQVGSTSAKAVDVRVVAATNVDVEQAVADGRFRADLFSRLMGLTIAVPPLRKRRDDILRLTRHFLRTDPVDLTPDAAEALLVHDWTYNVRQLCQIVSAVAPDARRVGRLEVDLLPEAIRHPIAARAHGDVRDDPEAPLWMRVRRDVTPGAEELRLAVAHYKGNIHGLAEFFGKDRRQIYRWLEQHDIDIERYRGEGE